MLKKNGTERWCKVPISRWPMYGGSCLFVRVHCCCFFFGWLFRIYFVVRVFHCCRPSKRNRKCELNWNFFFATIFKWMCILFSVHTLGNMNLIIFCCCWCVLFADFCFELGGSAAPRRVCCIFDWYSVVESHGALHTHIVRVIYN